ncbi:hypothetical protein PG996_004502 [Apiospora saccharicola]|uniref:Transposase n=1 Tax=Apiospora saccharicola TaxID=335842 RepID=A0ABR1W4B4_9PEZI
MHRWFRMHRSTERCAELLKQRRFYFLAAKVGDDVKRVYDDAYLTYNRWNHGWDRKKQWKDPRTVKRWMKRVGFKV